MSRRSGGRRKEKPHGRVGPRELVELNDDILIHILSYLSPPNIVRLRQTCRRLYQLSRLRIVWTNAFFNFILAKGFPFPSYYLPLENLSDWHLQQRVLDAYTLSRNWVTGRVLPRAAREFGAILSMPIQNVKFIPRNAWINRFNDTETDSSTTTNLIVTLIQKVWHSLILWDLDQEPPARLSEWSRREAIIRGFCVNEVPRSNAVIAVGYSVNDEYKIDLLALAASPDAPSTHHLSLLVFWSWTFPHPVRPVTLKGDLLVLTDDLSRTIIYNWRRGKIATLQHTPPLNVWGVQNTCHAVVFAYHSILVVSARSIHLFPFPLLTHGLKERPEIVRAIARDSVTLGWIEAASVSLPPKPKSPHAPFPKNPLDDDEDEDDQELYEWKQKHSVDLVNQPISLFVRGERQSGWEADVHPLRLYQILPNPDFIPPEPPIIHPDQPPYDPENILFTDLTSFSGEEHPMTPAPLRTPGRYLIRYESTADSQEPPPEETPHFAMPYLFPPQLVSTLTSSHGAIRFPGIVLSPRMTALWLQPQDRAARGLVHDDDDDLDARLAFEGRRPLHLGGEAEEEDVYGGGGFSSYSRRGHSGTTSSTASGSAVSSSVSSPIVIPAPKLLIPLSPAVSSAVPQLPPGVAPTIAAQWYRKHLGYTDYGKKAHLAYDEDELSACECLVGIAFSGALRFRATRATIKSFHISSGISYIDGDGPGGGGGEFNADDADDEDDELTYKKIYNRRAAGMEDDDEDVDWRVGTVYQADGKGKGKDIHAERQKRLKFRAVHPPTDVQRKAKRFKSLLSNSMAFGLGGRARADGYGAADTEDVSGVDLDIGLDLLNELDDEYWLDEDNREALQVVADDAGMTMSELEEILRVDWEMKRQARREAASVAAAVKAITDIGLEDDEEEEGDDSDYIGQNSDEDEEDEQKSVRERGEPRMVGDLGIVVQTEEELEFPPGMKRSLIIVSDYENEDGESDEDRDEDDDKHIGEDGDADGGGVPPATDDGRPRFTSSGTFNGGISGIGSGGFSIGRNTITGPNTYHHYSGGSGYRAPPPSANPSSSNAAGLQSIHRSYSGLSIMSGFTPVPPRQVQSAATSPTTGRRSRGSTFNSGSSPLIGGGSSSILSGRPQYQPYQTQHQGYHYQSHNLQQHQQLRIQTQFSHLNDYLIRMNMRQSVNEVERAQHRGGYKPGYVSSGGGSSSNPGGPSHSSSSSTSPTDDRKRRRRKKESNKKRLTGTVIRRNTLNNWSALDYDEESGRIVLGSRGGAVILLQL